MVAPGCAVERSWAWQQLPSSVTCPHRHPRSRAFTGQALHWAPLSKALSCPIRQKALGTLDATVQLGHSPPAQSLVPSPGPGWVCIYGAHCHKCPHT